MTSYCLCCNHLQYCCSIVHSRSNPTKAFFHRPNTHWTFRFASFTAPQDEAEKYVVCHEYADEAELGRRFQSSLLHDFSASIVIPTSTSSSYTLFHQSASIGVDCHVGRALRVEYEFDAQKTCQKNE